MTLSRFDPICFGQYPRGEEPLVLHFQYEGQEDVYRYVLAEIIPVTDINVNTRRKVGEGSAEPSIREKYVKSVFLHPPKEEPQVEEAPEPQDVETEAPLEEMASEPVVPEGDIPTSVPTGQDVPAEEP